MSPRAVILTSLLLCASTALAEDPKTPPPPAPAPKVAPAAPAGKVVPPPAAPAPALPSSTSPAPPTAGPAGKLAPAPPATPSGKASAAPVPAAGFDIAKAKGSTKLALQLSRTVRLGGFELVATYKAADFALEEPQITKALEGYLCAANILKPGELRYSCVAIPQEDRGGVLATFAVKYREKAATPADFVIVKSDLVDDAGRSIPGLKLELVPAP